MHFVWYLFISSSWFHFNGFINRAPIGQGYGLTETCAGGAFSEFDDRSVGRVGNPLPSCYVKVLLPSNFKLTFLDMLHSSETVLRETINNLCC